MSRFTALLDASALYSMTITDLIIEMSRTGIFQGTLEPRYPRRVD